MGIKGLTDGEQPRFFKKIRLGIKGEKGVPKNVDHFVIEGAPEIAKVYGDKPKILHASFPEGLPMSEAMPTWNKWYDASQFLLCIGDGGSESNPGDATWRVPKNVKSIQGLTGKPGKWHKTLDRTCLGEDCPDHHRRGCQRVSQIRFTLPRVNPFQIYEISTGSINTILDFQNAFRTSNALKDMGNGMGTVFDFYKVTESRGGYDDKDKKITRNYKYMTCSINDLFWDTHGEEVLRKVCEIRGFNFIDKHKATLLQLSGVFQEGSTDMRNQIVGANDAEMKTLPSKDMQVPISPAKTNHAADAAKVINQTKSIADDPEVIAAVKSVYDAKGKPLAKAAVANQVKKYKTKEAIIAACKKAVGDVSPRDIASTPEAAPAVPNLAPAPPQEMVPPSAGIPLDSPGTSVGESLL